MAVFLSPVGGVAAQFFDNDGVPLAGGLIYTYTAGTSTPAATYTTSAGSIQHSNPIVLDAAGRVPTGEIWLSDALAYKFVIKDANSVLIATYDNVSGINSNFVAYTSQQEIQTATAGQTVFTLTTMQYQPATNNLSVFVDGVNQYGPGAQYAFVETDSETVTFVTGLHVGASVKFTTTKLENPGVADASQVSYTYPDSNAVQESVENRLAQYVSVKDFGAVGDGVTDDTDAIQNAIDYVITVGKALFFPAGVYNHTTITVTTDNRPSFIMYGESGGDWTPATTGSILQHTGSGYGFVFNTTSGAYDPLPCFIETLTFKGNTSSDGGLEIIAHGHMNIEKCVFTGFTNGAGVTFSAGTNFEGVNRIFNCTFALSSIGLRWVSESYNNVFSIENSTFIDLYAGIQFGSSIQYCQSRNTNIWKNHFENCASYAISAFGSAWNMSIIGNYFEQNTANCPPAIAFFNATGAVFTEPHRCIHISDNYIQYIPLDTGGAIYFQNGVGIKIENTMLAFGTTSPKYFVYLESTVTDAYVEFPRLPNGVTAANSYSARLATYYNRTFNSNENVPVPTTPFPMQIKGTGDAVGANTCTINSATYTQFNGNVTVNFDITLTTKSGTANGYAEIVGLPVVNGGNVAPVILYDVTGVTTVNPLTGYVANNSTKIVLIGNNGAQYDFNTYTANNARFKGTVTYQTA